jgi:signal transduction histidine kinase
MPNPSFRPASPEPRSFLRRHRVLVGVWTLSLVLFFTVEYVFVVPDQTVFVDWRPNGSAVVVDPLPAQSGVQAGDVLLAIDGIPLRNSDLQFRFGPPASFHTYSIQRGQTRVLVPINSGVPSLAEFGNLVLPGIVALEAWLLGFVIILFAQAQDEPAWLVGTVMLGFSVALAATPAADAGVPGARLAYEALVPLMCAGYVQMAYIPLTWKRQPLPRLRILYIVALALSALALVEIFVLNPSTSWFSLAGVRLESLVLVGLALTLIAAPVIVSVQAWRRPSDYVRRGTIILLTGIGIALLPFVLLSALPEAIFGVTWLPLGITLPLLAAIPATYGYVIYRHRFLNLDIFFGRTALLLVAALIISGLYFGGVRVMQNLPSGAALSPVLGIVFLFVGFGVVGQANPRLRQAVDVLLYGTNRHLETTQEAMTDELLSSPQRDVFSHNLLDRLPEVLQVREAALYMADLGGALKLAGSVKANPAASLQLEEIGVITDVTLRQATPDASIFRNVPWVQLAVPLRARGRLGGLLLLGDKVPDGYFDSREINFARQVAAAATIASENAELFELLQDQAKEALKVRASERMQLAYRLHDEPLHRMLTMLNHMEQMSSSVSADSLLFAGLAHQKDELKELTREIRDICAGLRPPILNQGLILTLQDIVRAARGNMPDTKVELICDETGEPNIADVALDAVYHVVREALNNVQRHACANEVSIEVIAGPSEMVITVKDNGRGTQLTTTSLPELLRGRHLGVIGMYQWAEAAGGRMELLPAAPRGTLVQLTLPIQPDRELISAASN